MFFDQLVRKSFHQLVLLEHNNPVQCNNLNLVRAASKGEMGGVTVASPMKGQRSLGTKKDILAARANY